MYRNIFFMNFRSHFCMDRRKIFYLQNKNHGVGGGGGGGLECTDTKQKQ